MSNYMPKNLHKLDETDKFLETPNLPRLNHKERENVNRSVTSKQMESVSKPPQKKSPGSDHW